MVDDFTTRKADLERAWEPLTDEHERQLERAEGTFERFANGESVDPLAIVGAYRSGKTQLLYHLFSQSWEQDIPAFYIGDPGQLLTEYAAADASDLNTWLQARIDDQLSAYVNDDPSEIPWFPNVPTETKRAFVQAHGDDLDPDEPVQTALLFDEVEQSYRDFIRVMDKDDDNPLRKINDGLQDSIKVWSFGMISAFEFIGEADWGRMREIRVPPLEVDDVRDLLADRRPEATGLATTLWWLARGRTGLIIKFVDGLPEDPDSDATEWLRGLAETNFRDTKLLNNLWTERERDEWEQAIRALLFDSTGLDAWQLTQQTALPATRCQYLAVDILKDVFTFEQTERHQNALEIIDRNLKRVFSGLCVTEDNLFPAFGLADEEQAEAFLSLVSDMIVSFEPASDERSTALEAVDDATEGFHTQWIEHVSDAELVDRSVATVTPTILQSAFPPIAVNPERVSDRSTESLEPRMDRGLTVAAGTPAAETVDIRLCPTEATFQTELESVTTSYDITAPTLLVVPEDADFDHDATGVDVYERHQLLGVESYRSNRFWTFVVHLFGRLSADGVSDPYQVDDQTISRLLADCDDREVRNTIETLYDQLRQVTIDLLDTFAATYRETYSLDDSESLLWEESRLDGMRPYWASGKFVESTVALSYLLLVGPEYESGRAYAALHEPLQSGIEDDLVSGGRDGFQFKTYLESLFVQDGFSRTVRSERDHYTADEHLAAPVRRTRDALSDLAALTDVSDIVDQLDDPALSLQDTQVPVASLDGLTYLGNALIRALLTAGLTTGSDPEIDMGTRLQQVMDDIDAAIDTVTNCRQQVETYDSRLRPPDSATVGTWFEIDSGRLERYQSNLERLRDGVMDLRDKIDTEPASGPVAYHYWFLLRLYLDDITGQIEAMESTIEAPLIAAITEAGDRFDEVHSILASESFVEFVFEDRDTLVDQFEEYGDQIFDLRSQLTRMTVGNPDDDGVVLSQVEEYDDRVLLSDPEEGDVSLSLPGDADVLKQLNQFLAEHRQHLTTLKDELDALESTATDVEQVTEETRKELLTLLPADQTMEAADD
ncbi:hypothetical protein [Halorientalis marina]|uniref:hypothetical protein n=1 Tax=Halorientalis marina TaxID=2931976 RepID=UPI001FF1A437|nr:hypothetical protein [Halorientalis marina]